jgi:phage-related protein
MREILLYETTSGNNPVANYIDGLDAKTNAKVARALDLLEEYGVAIGPPHVKPLPGTDRLWELRVPFGGQAYCLLFFPDGQKIVLLHGFTKKSQKLPGKELQTAISRMKEYLRRR